jgi:hypothetical protein
MPENAAAEQGVGLHYNGSSSATKENKGLTSCFGSILAQNRPELRKLG